MTTERPHKKMTAKRMTLGSLEKEKKKRKGKLDSPLLEAKIILNK